MTPKDQLVQISHFSVDKNRGSETGRELLKIIYPAGVVFPAYTF